ncbi:MAG TPA: metallophosphoesterase [Candidatus Baltobacteraceae bacterium]|nr:metallophosphoesterase [Candidatus Baltobacteraceae bacterium]
MQVTTIDILLFFILALAFTHPAFAGNRPNRHLVAGAGFFGGVIGPGAVLVLHRAIFHRGTVVLYRRRRLPGYDRFVREAVEVRFRIAVLALALLALAFAPARAAAPGSSQTWLVVSDIHLDPFDSDEYPARVGSDTNLALFDQVIDQMKHSVPDPAVILIPGDFLAHGFPGKAHTGAPASSVAQTGLRTMQRIASAFAKAFPHARFAIALGNNDASCGDYHTDIGEAYLLEVARIWKPLIDRDGAAPNFVHSFLAGGYYAVDLPMPGLRVVVVNTVPMSSQYRGNCDGAAPNAARNELAWLHAELAAPPEGMHNVVMMHIPPGYDPVSTQYAHGFLAWSFLQGGYNATLLSTLENPKSRVRLVITGHLHHFDFRVARGIPMLVFGSISPVYRNNPAFYALHVDGDGTVNDVDTYAYDEWSGDWLDGPRSFDTAWGVPRVDAQSLIALHVRLGNDESLRAQWALGSVGWPSNPSFKWASWTGRWRIPWCSQTILRGDYAKCADIRARVDAFRATVAAIAVAIVVAIILLIGALERRRVR